MKYADIDGLKSQIEDLRGEVTRLNRIINDLSHQKYVTMGPDGVAQIRETPLLDADMRQGWCYVYTTQD
jgi:hypothetical protein